MDRFRYDDNECRQYAYYQIGGVTSARDAANQSAVAALWSAVPRSARWPGRRSVAGRALRSAPESVWWEAAPTAQIRPTPQAMARSASTTMPISSACTSGPFGSGPGWHGVPAAGGQRSAELGYSAAPPGRAAPPPPR